MDLTSIIDTVKGLLVPVSLYVPEKASSHRSPGAIS
jgi:hypothetical protein